MRRAFCVGFLAAACSPQSPQPNSQREQGDAQASSRAATVNTMAAPLDSLDFLVAAIEPGTDSATVLARLGRPQRVSSSEGAYGETLVEWHYPDLTLHFFDTPGVSALEITGPRYATARKVRVGDSTDRVLTAYGVPPETENSDGRLQYCDRRYDECLYLVRFLPTNGRIESIYIGNVVD
jgi:hypothetical protein